MTGDRVQAGLLRDTAKVDPLRGVLVQEAVHVLVRTAFPWPARLAEVDRDPGRTFEREV